MSKFFALFALLLVAQMAFAGYDQFADFRIKNGGKEPIHVSASLK